MILGEIKRYLRDNNSIRVARSIKDIAYHALKIKEDLINKLGHEPKISEIAKEMGVKEYDVALALDSMKDTISMFEPIYSDGGDVIYLSDQIEDKKSRMKNISDNIALNIALDKLKDKEKKVIVDRYLIGKTQMELASEIGISQAQISRLEKNGLENIKKYMSW